MLSQTCKTAIKAVIYLAARFESGEKAGIKEIADIIEASEHTVGKMLQVLVKEDVIKSLKGPNGGFFISAKQKNQPVINIVEAIDGNELFKQCGLGLSKCSSSHPCPIHDEYKMVRDLFEKMCRSNTVNDLCAPVNKGLAYLIG
ncbi:MAG: Rrf2 family transcriptional regulator [Chitinophagaceae bacterium]|nr:Rrf2 family transcriptional regulator [Chitinophagaceae bacterium]MBL0304883.1 Rrf2 family transcriptional regulator [Chitinophagaceae bacterium]MBP6214569.1 Rrf2 family transcriptional regulator [Chitinophagaceae bacterium]MBP6417231.1 Rrf2 family transcriptional regulator [Chitinophagaceae bacterium]HQV59634.1 Rrf2 family transcriptional regulator [Chitinophagaceae bacterium]